MYIKSIELEGFKSYANKQLITGFHPQFNAITGYNGSGKSNILDAICFLLGLTKLENIRAKNMTDLIFKQGQASVNRAVVTIVFDNRDKDKSPYNLSDHDEIVIRRQITLNVGKGPASTYILNGQATTSNKIHDIFRGVGLNVNNPHFLIMQGRITKVLNMKPDEILGMIEEAAGTKMYDQKKRDVHKLIASRDLKIGEADRIVMEILIPRMEKMKEDAKILVEVKKFEKIKMHYERKLDAFIYYQNIMNAEDNNDAANKTREKIQSARDRIQAIDNEIAENEQLLLDIEKNKNETDSNNEIEKELKARTEERVNMEGEKDEVAEAIKQIQEDRKRKEASIEKDEKLLEKKKMELNKILSDHDAVDKQQSKDAEDAKRYRLEIEALTRGMMTNEQGEQVSIEQKIQESRTETAEIEASMKTAQNRQERLKPRVQELTKQIEKHKKQHTSEMAEIRAREAEVDRFTTEMQKLDFNEVADANMKERAKTLRNDIDEIQAGMARLLRTVGKGRYEFVYRDPPLPGFRRERDVLGTVATLFSVKPDAKAYTYAVEIACGNFQKIVWNLSANGVLWLLA
ncbi:unnamed protein product [Caenorhabditis bovis]|uniref:RecF/RecN/SMC N-terminal domain-containing protein n=1 Tax=Caenorhabditis bovis TaxID=2654633 RepID=A0A8S1ERM4_9PELO|nr:unnamed protein product [Caenorhabditis bovis]